MMVLFPQFGHRLFDFMEQVILHAETISTAFQLFCLWREYILQTETEMLGLTLKSFNT